MAGNAAPAPVRLDEVPCFVRYWTPGFISILWLVLVAIATLAVLFGVVVVLGGLASEDGFDFGQIVSGLMLMFGSLFGLVLARVSLETVSVLFDIRYELKRGNAEHRAALSSS